MEKAETGRRGKLTLFHECLQTPTLHELHHQPEVGGHPADEFNRLLFVPPKRNERMEFEKLTEIEQCVGA